MKKSLKKALKDLNIKHVKEDRNTIRFSVDINENIGNLKFVLYPSDDAIVVYAKTNLKLTSANSINVSEYLHRANYGLIYGNFEINYDDGTIYYKTTILCDNESDLTKNKIYKSIIISCNMFKKYGDGLNKLVSDINPKELIEEAEKSDVEE